MICARRTLIQLIRQSLQVVICQCYKPVIYIDCIGENTMPSAIVVIITHVAHTQFRLMIAELDVCKLYISIVVYDMTLGRTE